MKANNRILSLLMVLAIIMSIWVAAPLPVQAAGTSYTIDDLPGTQWADGVNANHLGSRLYNGDTLIIDTDSSPTTGFIIYIMADTGDCEVTIKGRPGVQYVNLQIRAYSDYSSEGLRTVTIHLENLHFDSTNAAQDGFVHGLFWQGSNPLNAKITMKNSSISGSRGTASNGTAIYFDDDIELIIEGNNTLSGGSGYGLGHGIRSQRGSVSITGNGTLNINGGDANLAGQTGNGGFGIQAKKDITIDLGIGGEVHATAGASAGAYAGYHGIFSEGALTLNGIISATGGDSNRNGGAGILVTGGDMHIKSGSDVRATGGISTDDNAGWPKNGGPGIQSGRDLMVEQGAKVHAIAGAGNDVEWGVNLNNSTDCTFTNRGIVYAEGSGIATKSGGGIYAGRIVLAEGSETEAYGAYDGTGLYVKNASTALDCDIILNGKLIAWGNKNNDDGIGVYIEDTVTQGGGVYVGSPEVDIRGGNGQEDIHAPKVYVTDGNIQTISATTGELKNKVGGDDLYKLTVNVTPAAATELSVPVTGSGGSYTYRATTGADGKGYIWLPAGAQTVTGKQGSWQASVKGILQTNNDNVLNLNFFATAPTITNNQTTLTVQQGETDSLTVTATGTPAPDFSATLQGGGALPSWISLGASSGVLMAAPSPTEQLGDTVVTVTASNAILPDATKDFTIAVLQSPEALPAVIAPNPMNLDLSGVNHDTAVIRLGLSGIRAEIHSSNPEIASVEPGEITSADTDRNVNVLAKRVGTTEVTAVFYDVNGVMTGIINDRFTVNVTNSYTPPPTRDSGRTERGSDRGNDRSRADIDYTAVQSTWWIDAAQAKSLADAAKANDLSYIRFRRSGSTGIRANAVSALSGLRLEHDTLDGAAVAVRVAIPQPELLKTDMLLSGAVKGNKVEKRQAFFEKWHSNKIRVISMEQQSAWGQPMEIVAKVDLTDMDITNLYFYSYDAKKNTYKQIATPKYWIDKNGYLHFDTEFAGDIIISEGVFVRK